FGALFPQFIDASQPVWPQLLILGSTYLFVDGVLLLAWGWFAAKTANRFKQVGGVWMNCISGLIMLAAAGLLASKNLEVETAK
ncbi:MAG: LysE family translocator, partial [Pseudomonadota bacterium]